MLEVRISSLKKEIDRMTDNESQNKTELLNGEGILANGTALNGHSYDANFKLSTDKQVVICITLSLYR